MARARWEEIVDEQRAQWLEAQHGFDWAQALCDSPIERVFLACCMGSGWFEERRHDRASCDRAMDLLESSGLRPTARRERVVWDLFTTTEDERFVLAVQPTLILEDRRMRPDFALVTCPTFDGGCKVSIELDGHDFHERTPEQAERDKSKDRLLQQHGWIALRFTGREVLRDPQKCVEEAMAHGRARIGAAKAKGMVIAR
jgi:hypothetical protein